MVIYYPNIKFLQYCTFKDADPEGSASLNVLLQQVTLPLIYIQHIGIAEMAIYKTAV